MKDIVESINQWFKERTVSPLYGTYALSIILVNWQFFFTLFVQDQSALSIPKIEYVEQKYLSDPWYLHLWMFLILPLIISYFIIWWLPYITGWAHKKHLDFYFAQKGIYDKANLQYERKKLEQESIRSTTLEKLAGFKEKQNQSQRKIERTDNERWRDEYDSFTRLPLFKSYGDLIRRVYDDNGYNYKDNLTGIRPISSKIIASADAMGLISIDSNMNQFSFTEKGKYFMDQYLRASN